MISGTILAETLTVQPHTGPCFSGLWLVPGFLGKEVHMKLLACSHRTILKSAGLWCVIAMAPYCNVFLNTKDNVLMSTRAVSAFMEDDLHILMGFVACGPAGMKGAKYSSRE